MKYDWYYVEFRYFLINYVISWNVEVILGNLTKLYSVKIWSVFAQYLDKRETCIRNKNCRQTLCSKQYPVSSILHANRLDLKSEIETEIKYFKTLWLYDEGIDFLWFILYNHAVEARAFHFPGYCVTDSGKTLRFSVHHNFLNPPDLFQLKLKHKILHSKL